MKSDFRSQAGPGHYSCSVAPAALAIALLATVAAGLGAVRLGVPALLHQRVRGADPDRAERRQLQQALEAAREHVAGEARSLGDLGGRVQAIQHAITTQLGHQQEDRILLAGLNDKLSETPPDQPIVAGGSSWARGDVEHEARLILNRYHARQQHVATLQDHLGQLQESLDYWRAIFRDHRDRLQGVTFQVELAEMLRQSHQIMAAFEPCQWQATARAIADTGSDAAEVVQRYRSEAAVRRMVRDLHDGSTTPAADAIRLETAPGASLDSQIDAVLNDPVFHHTP